MKNQKEELKMLYEHFSMIPLTQHTIRVYWIGETSEHGRITSHDHAYIDLEKNKYFNHSDWSGDGYSKASSHDYEEDLPDTFITVGNGIIRLYNRKRLEAEVYCK